MAPSTARNRRAAVRKGLLPQDRWVHHYPKIHKAATNPVTDADLDRRLVTLVEDNLSIATYTQHQMRTIRDSRSEKVMREHCADDLPLGELLGPRVDSLTAPFRITQSELKGAFCNALYAAKQVLQDDTQKFILFFDGATRGEAVGLKPVPSDHSLDSTMLISFTRCKENSAQLLQHFQELRIPQLSRTLKRSGAVSICMHASSYTLPRYMYH